MKHTIVFIMFLIIVSSTSAQVDTLNKTILVNDHLPVENLLLLKSMPVLTRGYYLHFFGDTILARRSNINAFYYNPIPVKYHYPTNWDAAGSFMLSFLAEQTKHQYIFRPGK